MTAAQGTIGSDAQGTRYDVVKSCLIHSLPPTNEAWGLAADGSLVPLDRVVSEED